MACGTTERGEIPAAPAHRICHKQLLATRSMNKTSLHTTQSVPLCCPDGKLKFLSSWLLPDFTVLTREKLGKVVLCLSFCAALLLLLPHLWLPARAGPQQLDHSRDQGMAPQQQSQGLKRKQVTFSLLAPVGPVLIILVYLLHAHGGEFTIAAKQSLCLPWQGGEIDPAYSTREGAWVLFEFERSRDTLLFHFLLSQLLASVPNRPFWNCSRPLSPSGFRGGLNNFNTTSVQVSSGCI